MEGLNVTQRILAIQRDPNLTDAEKAKKRQELLSGKWLLPSQDESTGGRPESLVRASWQAKFAALSR